LKVLVLGGDGFCGWPCAVNLADQGHEVLIVDNLSRRKIDIDLEVESLTPITTIGERLKSWEEIGGKPMRFVHMDTPTSTNACSICCWRRSRMPLFISLSSGQRPTR
jgi:nucleoside-diphosphate-sugar epimerase